MTKGEVNVDNYKKKCKKTVDNYIDYYNDDIGRNMHQ